MISQQQTSYTYHHVILRLSRQKSFLFSFQHIASKSTIPTFASFAFIFNYIRSFNDYLILHLSFLEVERSRSRSRATTRRKMSLPRRRAANHRLVFFVLCCITHTLDMRKEEVKSALCMAFRLY